MINIYINNQAYKIKSTSYNCLINSYRNRIIKILYLKDNNADVSEINKYIDSILIDLYGCYIMFDDDRFINAIAELTGIKYNINDKRVRKFVLDLANFILNIKWKEDDA